MNGFKLNTKLTLGNYSKNVSRSLIASIKLGSNSTFIDEYLVIKNNKEPWRECWRILHT